MFFFTQFVRFNLKYLLQYWYKMVNTLEKIIRRCFMKNDLVIAGLLHDIGKIIYRTGRESGNHSILGANFLKEINDTQLSGVDVFSKNIINAVRYHHAKELKSAKLNNDAIAYLIYEADNIASGIDRRENEEIEGEEGNRGLFDKYTPLQSIYNILNSKSKNMYYSEITSNLIKDFIII